VEEAVKDLRTQGLMDLTWLAGQTWRELQREMREGPWHVFHFIGHGGFDHNTDEGFIALADEEGYSDRFRATKLARLLADHFPLRLVLLNSCEGARGSELDLFSSTAAILVRRGIPAVLAMQYEITDRAAIEFARAFYEALADGMPVDAAVAEGRKAVSLAVANTLEWGTPVLYMRSPDGVLFSIQEQEVRVKKQKEAETKPQPAGSGIVLSWLRSLPLLVWVGLLALLLLVSAFAAWPRDGIGKLIFAPTATMAVATVQPTPTLTNIPTSVPTAANQSATPTAAPTQSPTPTEAPRPTPTPTCPAVSGPFAAVWNSVQGTIGCASSWATTGFIGEENFERGKMFWRELIDYAQILALFNDGTWQIVKHSPFIEGSPEFSCPDANTPSQCPPTPKRGFGMVWCDVPEIRSRLGNATDCERGYQGSMQQFERGFMLQTDSGAIYVFYDDRRWELR
jgi:hypothetical protein